MRDPKNTSFHGPKLAPTESEMKLLHLRRFPVPPQPSPDKDQVPTRRPPLATWFSPARPSALSLVLCVAVATRIGQRKATQAQTQTGRRDDVS